MARVLVVDDEHSICWSLTRLGTECGHEVTTAGSVAEALTAVAATSFDLVLLDVRLPDRDGLSALPELREHLHNAPVVVMTAYGDLPTAVEAVRRGAFEYLIKPFDLALVERVFTRALKLGELVVESNDVAAEGGNSALIGRSAPMQAVFREVALAAASDVAIHISGESGVGKELIARAIHNFSQRANGPLVIVHLASLSDSLAESELFGHVRGAFTGAGESRPGLLEQAHGGTLFFDEVAEVSPTLQVKLLRAIEHGEILPVGSSEPRQVDFRVVTATHQDLRQLVADGKFRHDLFYRLNTFPIRVPPLRERLEDLSDLATHFARLTARRSKLNVPRITQELVDELANRSWPGNVRELRNAIEFAVIQACGGVLLSEHLPAQESRAPTSSLAAEMVTVGLRQWAEQLWSTPEPPTAVYERLMELVEKPVLEVALAQHSGQVAAAARSLGLHRITVHRKARALGLLSPPTKVD